MKKALDEVKESWNCHYVRKSRHFTAHGIPNEIYVLPESVGAEDYGKNFNQGDLAEIESATGPADIYNNQLLYQEYFLYSAEILGLEEPQDWRAALAMFKRLLEVA